MKPKKSEPLGKKKKEWSERMKLKRKEEFGKRRKNGIERKGMKLRKNEPVGRSGRGKNERKRSAEKKKMDPSNVKLKTKHANSVMTILIKKKPNSRNEM